MGKKLTSEQINTIREEVLSGKTKYSVAKEIGISFSPRKKDKFAIIILEDDIEQHTEQIKEIIKKALSSYA